MIFTIASLLKFRKNGFKPLRLVVPKNFVKMEIKKSILLFAIIKSSDAKNIVIKFFKNTISNFFEKFELFFL